MCRYLVRWTAVLALIGGAFPCQIQAQDKDSDQEIDEIVVTASKREMSVQDIPMSVTALGSEFIGDIGANEFEDVYRFAPGLNVRDGGPGLKEYIIRGISLQGNIPSVGQYVDEWLTSVGNGGAQFDAKLFDINRVEVLKGPQGTLYGAAAMGGIVRVITNKPDATGFDFKVETDFSATRKGGDNTALKAMVNIPLVENQLAFRGSAYWYDVSGFIDNVVIDEEDVNGEESRGFRGSLMWTPNEDITFEVSALYQNSDFGSEQKVMVNAPASPGFDYGQLGELFGIQNIAPTPGTGSIDDFETQKYVSDKRHDKVEAISGRLDWDFDLLSFTGIGTYSRRDFSQDQDCWNLTFWHGPGCIVRSLSLSDTTTFEARFASNWENPFKLLFGFYYEKFTANKPGSFYNNGMNANGDLFDIQRQPCMDAFAANGVAGIPETQDPIFDFACEFVMGTIQPPGAPPNRYSLVGQPRLGCTEGNEKGLLPTCSDFYRVLGERDREQRAIFGEIRYEVSDALQIGYGFRYYELKDEAFGDMDIFNLFEDIFGTTELAKRQLPKEDDIIHRFDVSYNLNQDMMTYFLFSQGYRQGGENLPGLFTVFPLTYDTDTTDNYEIGLKSTWFDRKLMVNVTAYWVNIDGIQERLRKCDAVLNVCEGYTDNVANAVSRGFELETAVRATDKWSYRGSLTYGVSELAEDSVAAVGDESGSITPNPTAGFKGDRLPNTPNVTAAVNLRYDGSTDIGGLDLPTFADLTWFYVGSSYTEFNDSDPVYFKNDAYTETRLRAGIYGDSWRLSFYVNNLFDETNDLGSRARIFTTVREITVNRPRTIGINLQLHHL